jgi:hypothetical protein
MEILRPRPPVPCNAPDSCAGQALRTGGARLVGAGRERSACGIVASEQPALIADAESAVRKLMYAYRAAHEVNALASRRQLENQVFEGDGVVVAHHPLMLARQYQLQLDAAQFNEGAFRLGWLYHEAAVEIRDKVLLQVTVGGFVIGDPIVPELLRQSPLNGVPKARSLRPRAWGESDRI